MYKNISIISTTTLVCEEDNYVILTKIQSMRIMTLASGKYAVQVYTDGRALHGVTVEVTSNLNDARSIVRDIASATRLV